MYVRVCVFECVRFCVCMCVCLHNKAWWSKCWTTMGFCCLRAPHVQLTHRGCVSMCLCLYVQCITSRTQQCLSKLVQLSCMSASHTSACQRRSDSGCSSRSTSPVVPSPCQPWTHEHSPCGNKKNRCSLEECFVH